MLMELNDKDFDSIYGNETSNTTAENVCIDCGECILCEYNYFLATAGYDDKGNDIIISCKLKNYA